MVANLSGTMSVGRPRIEFYDLIYEIATTRYATYPQATPGERRDVTTDVMIIKYPRAVMISALGIYRPVVG